MRTAGALNETFRTLYEEDFALYKEFSDSYESPRDPAELSAISMGLADVPSVAFPGSHCVPIASSAIFSVSHALQIDPYATSPFSPSFFDELAATLIARSRAEMQ
jgi:hypothetical protein